MSLFVKVENEEVTQVWDTQPPAGESGWQSAVEVRPSITDGKQVYTGHTFDLSANPVQIVYGVQDLTIAQRKEGLIGQAKSAYQQVANEQTQLETNDGSGDAALVSDAKDAKDQNIAAINGCTTHADLDGL
tara:strand:+ start:165 stop:557 length:393 start_codon:yes stop_codon:yes gene_type:complete